MSTRIVSQRIGAETVRIHVPGDKSITHRALLFATLARGRSIIRNALVSLDTGSTASCLRALGVRIPEINDNEVVIDADGAAAYQQPRAELDCGNSGTTARLLLGTLSGCAFRSVLTGDASLRSRPMRRVTRPLSEAGARFEELGEPDRLPVAVQGGALRHIDHVSAQSSAQVKSALLLAGVTAKVSARVREPHRSRDHTERMLAAMGAPIRVDQNQDGYSVLLEPVAELQPIEITVPGDFSSATFFLAYGLLSGTSVLVERAGINPSRTGFLEIACRMGGRIDVTAEREEGGEPVADLRTRESALRATVMQGSDIVRAIDEVPILAILATRAEGETRITGASELRVKESDRIAAIVENLRAVGVSAEELSDGLTIRGTHAPLRGRVRTHHDHRIAMAFGVLAALPGNEIEIDNPDVAAVSFPRFWEQLNACAAGQ